MPVFLIVRSGQRVCGLPVADVVETMRPLALEPLPGVPPFVLGVAPIRGVPTAVIDLTALIGEERSEPPRRFVLMRAGEGCVAVAVEGVARIAQLDESELTDMAPLLARICEEVATVLASVDAPPTPLASRPPVRT